MNVVVFSLWLVWSMLTRNPPMDLEIVFLFCSLFFESLTSFRHVDNMFFMNLVVYVRRSIDSRSSLYSKFESFSIILIGIDVWTSMQTMKSSMDSFANRQQIMYGLFGLFSAAFERCWMVTETKITLCDYRGCFLKRCMGISRKMTLSLVEHVKWASMFDNLVMARASIYGYFPPSG